MPQWGWLRERRRRGVVQQPLSKEARNGFLERWRSMQERFVDEPHVATMEADRLVTDVMRARGYPVDDFDRRADDISVDYPELVANYRSAHEVAARQSVGDATADDLRRAMRHYRALFDELLETGAEERLVR